MPTLQSRVRSASNPLTAEVNGELVIMDTDSGAYYSLDAIGTDIWNRLAAPIDVETLCRSLEQGYDAQADIIRRDVLDLLDSMVEKGLVEVVS